MPTAAIAQLQRDLLLTPEERARAAEDALALDRLRDTGAEWKLSTGGG